MCYKQNRETFLVSEPSPFYTAPCSRSSCRRCCVRKVVLRNFAKFTGKHLCQSLFLNEVAGFRPETLLKKRLWHRRFPVNFAKFLKTPFLKKTSGRVLILVLTYLRGYVDTGAYAKILQGRGVI